MSFWHYIMMMRDLESLHLWLRYSFAILPAFQLTLNSEPIEEMYASTAEYLANTEQKYN